MRYWMKDGRVLINRGKPVAGELAQHARFIVVRGRPIAEGESAIEPLSPYKRGVLTIRHAFVTDNHAVSVHLLQ